MSIDFLLTNSSEVTIYALLTIMCVLSIWVIRLEIKLHRFFRGKKAGSFEKHFIEIIKELEKQEETNKRINENINTLDNRIKKSIRGIETIRFSPFKGSGGNQSFATAFVTEEGDGVIISSLYSSERFSAFAKPIRKNVPEFELSKEETDVFHKAKKRL